MGGGGAGLGLYWARVCIILKTEGRREIVGDGQQKFDVHQKIIENARY
jgi:hypothetical protein